MATETAFKGKLLDRALGLIAPRLQLQRVRARLATDALYRHYEAASQSYRTQNWHRATGDANAVNGRQWSLARLRELGRDLERNNGLIRQANRTIGNHVVGWGIVAKAPKDMPKVAATWTRWAETKACDADGRSDFYGLQKLIIRSVARDGEVLVRRRQRLLSDGLPIPIQLQVLEADFLDTFKTGPLPNGGYIIQGVEFDPLGTRVAYWLFPKHPGALLFQNSGSMFPASKRIPASEIIHVFDRERAGQVRAASWYASIILPAKDVDEYRDGQLMKQKIAACLAVIVTDPDGSASPVGTGADDSRQNGQPPLDLLSPGAIMNAPPGRTVQIVQPPSVRDYDAYIRVEHRGLAKGIGVTYEDFTGDYSNVNFSSARMARIEHYENVHDWRWQLLIPQFCDDAWAWAMQALQIMGLAGYDTAPVEWTPPPMPMIEPDKEGLALQRNVRSGIETFSGALRERGLDPDQFFAELQADNKRLDDLGIVLDSDPRKTTQAGQLQAAITKTPQALAEEDTP